MLEQQLQKLGLPYSQSKAYSLLVEKGSTTPGEFATKSGESRTNAYMVLDKLVDLGLAFKDEVNKKLIYRPLSPASLQKLAEKKRTKAYELEQKIKNAMPALLQEFHSKRTQPGVRFFQGKKGIEKMYDEFLQNKEDKYYIRTLADEQLLTYKPIHEFLEKRAKLGIHAEGLSPNEPISVEFSKKNDKRLNRTVTFFPAQYYTAPVEISVSGDQSSFISYGEEIVGVIIDSPQIAEAMRQAFKIMKVGAKELSKQKSI
jgi:sugar-specific transcriptional regulator TrmB